VTDLAVKLDRIDRKLLKILQDNAKTPYSKISDELGVIKRFQAIVDPEKVGKGVLAIVAIKCIPQKYEKVLEELSKMKDVYEIYDVTGEYYTLTKIRVGSREELARILDHIGDIDGVESTRTMYVLRVIKEEYRINIE